MRALLVAANFLAGLVSASSAQSVHLLYDPNLPQAEYAAGAVADALEASGYSVTSERTGYDHLISITLNGGQLEPESYSIIPEGRTVTVYGGDARGLIYGSLALAENLRNGVRLDQVQKQTEAAHLPFRAIKHNLPWDSYRPSSAIDQHYDTVRDLAYWEAFLDMMVENRFNVLSLWNLHPFTYMILPRNFPEASPFTQAELAEWKDLYRGIFRMARERGIDTYIVSWSIFVSREFAEAYGVVEDNFYPTYYVDGDTSEIVKRYIRESVTQVLEEYPDLSGFGISHGEGMGGMTPRQRQDWMDETYIEGIRRASRPAKLIHRVPFSANLGSAGSTSADTERLTREAMERLDFLDGPIWVEMKFNWSHAHSTPQLVKVHGGELGDTYFVPEPENYKITWMARNEDFFALRWGVPDFIRAHIAANGGHSYVGGYFVGSETYIPAKDYFTAIEAPVDWTYAFERQWLFYKLWGRLLYNPETPDEVFRAEFVRRYGPGAQRLLDAYALASATPLRLASLFDSTWDFTLYGEGFLSLSGDSVRYITVDRLIEQPTLDPGYVSVRDYVATLADDARFEGNEMTPPRLADLLEADAEEAFRLVKGIDVSRNPSLMYEVSDVKVWANLGLHLAEKLRGAVSLERYRVHGDEAHRQAAVRHLSAALEAWDRVIEITRPIYRDMPLTHYNHGGFEANVDNLFHWELIREEVPADIEIARNATQIPAQPRRDDSGSGREAGLSESKRRRATDDIESEDRHGRCGGDPGPHRRGGSAPADSGLARLGRSGAGDRRSSPMSTAWPFTARRWSRCT